MTDPTQFQPYIDSNYPPPIMQSQNLNFVAYYYLDGSMAFNVTYDLSSKGASTWPLPSELAKLSPSHPFLKNATVSTSYYVATHQVLNNQLMVLVSAPITTSDGLSPANGITVFGRALSSTIVLDIATRAQLCVSFHNVKDTSDKVVSSVSSYTTSVEGIAVDLASADWKNNDAFLVQTLNKGNTNPGRQCYKSTTGESPLTEDRIGAFMLINDAYGKPIVIVRADQSRVVWSLGQVSIGVALGAVAGVTLVLSFVILCFVECAVLRRMINLAHQVYAIGDTGDVSKRVAAYGQDEVGVIANNINDMLGELQKTQVNLKNEQEKLQALLHKISIEEQRFRSINNAINDFILLINSNGLIIQSNTSFHDKFQYAHNKTDNVLNITKVFHDVSLQQFIELVKTEQEIETVGISAFGEKIHVALRVSSVRLFIDDNEMDAFVVVAKNMNENKKLMESLDAQQKKLTLLQNFVAFDQLMSDPDMRAAYKKFCQHEHCEESILFVETVLDYRKTRKAHERVQKQQAIVTTFLTKGAQYELNLSKQVLENELFLIKQGVGQVGLFDKLLDVVKGAMVVDSFQRFFKWFEENKEKLFRASSDIKAEDVALLQKRLLNSASGSFVPMPYPNDPPASTPEENK